MLKTAKVLLLCFILFPLANAQQPAMNEPFALFKEGIELFDKAKYGAAYNKFEAFIAKTTLSERQIEGKPGLAAQAAFYQALSAFHLLRNNTEALFEQFIQQYPVHNHIDEARFYIGKLYFLKKKYEEAVLHFQQIKLSSLPSELALESRYYIGYSYLKQADYPSAINHLGTAKRAKGEIGEQANYYYALANYQAGRYIEANRAFAEIPEGAKWKDISLYRANCLLKLGKYEELNAIAAQWLEDESTISQGTWIVLANAAYEQKEYSKTLQYFEKALKTRASLSRSEKYRYAYSCYHNQEQETAIRYFEQVVKPEDEIAQHAYYYLGYANIKKSEYEKARIAFDKASEMDFNPAIREECLFQYAKLSYQTRYYEEALAALQTFRNKYPQSVYIDELNGLIGDILLRASNYKAVIDYYEEPGKLNAPRAQKAYQQACYFYALNQYEKEQYSTAAKYFKIALNQSAVLKIKRDARYWYAESSFRIEKYGEAKNYYKSFLEQEKASQSELYPKAYYGLAWVELKNKNYQTAETYFGKYIALADANAEKVLYIDALMRAGDCSFVKKRYPQAIRYYRQVVDSKSKGVDYAWYQMGYTYFRMQEYQNAVKSYTALIENYKSSPYRDDALMHSAEIYLTWIKDWGKTARSARQLIREHPTSKYIPDALIRLAIAEYNSGQESKAIDYFKTVVFKHCYDRYNSLTALQNLSNMLSAQAYDDVYTQYRSKCPETDSPDKNSQEQELLFTVAKDRYLASNYQSAIKQLSDYLNRYPDAPHEREAHYLLAESYRNDGKFTQALETYKYLYNTEQADNFKRSALNQAAELYFKEGKYLISLELYTAFQGVAESPVERETARLGAIKNYFAMDDYAAAKTELLKLYTDPDVEPGVRQQAQIKLAQCYFFLAELEEAFDLFSEVMDSDKKERGAEAAYWVARVLFEQGQYEQAKYAALNVKNQYPAYNYWKAKAFLVLANAYLALGDTLQATEGTLKYLVEQDRYLDIKEEAVRKMKEINQLYGKEEDEE